MIGKHIVTIAITGLLVGASAIAGAEDSAAKQADLQITQSVKQKLASDESTLAPRILVSTRDGIVTLMGFELTPGQIKAAVVDADSIDGVRRVENRLQRG